VSFRARVVVGFVVFIAILFGAVYPTRTYLAQQRQLRAVHKTLALFKQQNGHLEAEANRLQSDDEIERIARARFNLVKPGEEAYAVVPVPPKPGDPAGQAATAVPPGPAPKHSCVSAVVVDWMVGALERVF
jgi:cell division protein FtsB